MRQLLADKLSGNQVGIWLLAPEHLRLGSWDLLCAWSQSGGETVGPRLALHLVHEAALCVAGLRRDRPLSQKGFELANGLPFVPSDQALQELLGRHSVADAQFLQVALGKVRRASGHFPGRLLALDPHRRPSERAPLVLADSEPYTAELIDAVHLQTPFELLVPLPQPASKRPVPLPAPERFTPRWAGYATAKEPYRLKRSRSPEPYHRIFQRSGERPEQYT